MDKQRMKDIMLTGIFCNVDMMRKSLENMREFVAGGEDVVDSKEFYVQMKEIETAIEWMEKEVEKQGKQ